MEIHGSREGLVVLTPLFVDVLSAKEIPKLYCSCAVAAHRFAGATEPDEPMVRIEMRSLRRFVEELRVLERDRRGEATLMCPQLQLTLNVYDRAGHVHLSVTLTETQYEGNHHVAVGFEVYPTDLPHILQDFEDLLTFPKPSNSSD